MKILLVGFKLSVGNELFMKTLLKNFRKNNIYVEVCGDESFVKRYNEGNIISKGGNIFRIFIDTLNPVCWWHFYKVIQKEDWDFVYFIASHPLNNISLFIIKSLNKLRRKNIISLSHIHDPLPHIGIKYGFIIFLSQFLQILLSDKIIVYGKYLKEQMIRYYRLTPEKVHTITHGAYRIDEKLTCSNVKNFYYVSLLGRIEKYKGIDVFLKAAEIVLKRLKENERVKFLIGGSGDFKPYKYLIKKFPSDFLEIRNYRLSDEEFDAILSSSYCCVLPYKEGTQTGNIQIAYYNACPVVVTKVGSLPELVEDGKTGFIIEPNNKEKLAEKILFFIRNREKNLEMCKNGFFYYVNKLRWSIIINEFIEELEKWLFKKRREKA